MPLQTHRTRVVPGVLTDDAWAEAVAGLRREFKAQGIVEQIGRQRTWTHVAGLNAEALLTRVTVEPAEGGTGITAESGGGSEWRASRFLGTIYGALVVFFGVVGVVTGDAVGFVVEGLMLAITLAIYVLLWFAVTRRARTRPAHFDEALDNVARLVAPETPVRETGAAETAVPRGAATEAPLRDSFLNLGDDAAPSAPDSLSRRTRA